jgi:RNA polymerase sigma-70 factor (ECF subfamily)
MLDKSRFDEVYAQTATRLRRYIGNMIGWVPLVEDITQEAYLRMLTTAPERLANAQLKSYLFKTATNIVRDTWRRGAILGEWMSSQPEVSTQVVNVEAIDGKIDLARVLGSLSIMQRSLLLLSYAEGYTHREISMITGIKEKSVKVLLFRARQRFISLYRAIDIEPKRDPS